MANPPTLAADTPADLAAAINAAAAAPERAELWDEAERLASEHQRPEDVADLYKAVLEDELPKDLALELCERAVGFLGDWFEEADRARAVLNRALDIDPTAEWAFRRLTMQLTVDRKWDEVLALYDRVIAATTEAQRRVELTTEAAQIAKDLAGRADRAIAYLEALSQLSPADQQTTASLERLLDREGRHRELVELWRSRMGGLDRAAALARRAQIAGCLLDRLESPAEALDEVGALLADAASVAVAIGLLERIFAFPTSDTAVRSLALDELKRHYEGAGRVGEIIRLLGAALDRAEAGEKAELHREIGARLASEGREAEALDHYAALIALDPASDEARAKLREVAEHTGGLDRYADALVRAADACGAPGREGQKARAITLLLEAATVRCDALGDEGGAATIYARVFEAEGVDDAAMLEVSRRLDDLLGRAGRREERLEALERRAGLEPDADARRSLRAEAARLADALGQADRALAAWELVLAEAPSDREAHEAIVALLDREARWEELIAALERSAGAPGSGEADRAHRVRAARVRADRLGAVAAAIDAWRAIEERFGSNEETVDALAALLESAGRWKELAEALEQGLRDAEDPERRLSIEQRLGDLYRLRSGEPDRALARYRDVLAERPGHEGARIGMRELLADPACRAEATGLLLQAFEVTGDWAGRLSLLEHRLEAASSDAARCALLYEAADLHEQRAGDARSALGALARALPLAPDDVSIERRLLGLAEASGGWDVAARALGDAVAACAPGPRAAELHHRHGHVLEERLSDHDGALAAYLAALALAPERLDVASAVLRAATAEGRWDVAARALVDVARARDAWDAGLHEAVEQAADAAGAWDAIASELGAAVTRDAALSAQLVGEIERAVAIWHRDRRGDPASAEEALLRSLGRGAGGISTLEMLAGVQRRAPGRPLVDTLIRIADDRAPEGGERVLAALREAADVAVSVLGDEALSRSILERLLSEVSARLDAGEEGHEALADHAIAGLVSLAAMRGDHERAVEILVSAAKLPLGPDAARARLHEAAAIAEDQLGDAERAVALYRAILEGTPGDERSLARLSAIFAGQGSVADLLALRKHELALAATAPARVALRLSIAELYGQIGDTPARLAALRENLADEPGHARSLEELAALLAADAQHAQLASVLEAQAGELEALGDQERAADLWTRASSIAETELGDVPRALADRIRVVEAMPTAETFDALARLTTARGDHAAAVGWLERRLDALAPGDAEARVATLARLAAAHVGAGHPEVARARLEGGLREHPGAEALRAPLRDLYRASGAWDLLVDLLTSPGEGAPRIDHLREAADICVKRLGSRDRAIPILEAMVSLAPADRVSRLALAGALRGAGQLDRARAVLASVLDEYGRRRPAERAEVHFQLAQVAAAAGQPAEARTQLETATSMSTEHPGALRMLAGLYRDAGDLERAERMYGALLLIALRQKPGAEEDPERPARSEVMVNLHWILMRLSQTGRADEMLASAFEAAKRSPFEAERLQNTLRDAGDHALLLRALEARLAGGDQAAAARAAVLSDMADVLGGPLARPEEAFGALLSALEIDPGSPVLCERAAAMARRAGTTRRWAEVLAGLAEGAEGRAAASLFYALGELHERDLGDPARALDAYTQAEGLGVDQVPVWRAIARVSAASGDHDGRMRVLRHLVNAGDAAGEGGALTEDLYDLAELELAAPGSEPQGLASLEWALGREPRHDRAAAMLRRSAEGGDAGVLAMYERVARGGSDPAVLLDALARLAAAEGATMDVVREAFALAFAAGDEARGDALLSRAIRLGEQNPAGLGESVWALVALADRREAAGAWADAIDHLSRAVDAAEPEEAARLAARGVAVALDRVGSLAVAAQVQERLLARDRHDRGVWSALLDLHRKASDAAVLEAKLREAIECAFDVTFRIELRMERGRLLQADRPEDAAVELEEVLQEDAENDEAAALLAKIYERIGRHDALAELMERPLTISRSHSDRDSMLTLSLRLGELWAKDKPEQAIDLYRSALEAAPDSVELLERLLALYASDDHGRDRADILERLARLAKGRDAAERALALAELRSRLDDEDGMVRALDLGFRADPSDTALRERLATFYTQHERWAELADLYAFEGASLQGAAAVARLREAAAIFRDRLDRPADAARALGAAAQIAPDDLGLLVDHARVLARAGGHDEAIAQVSAALDRAQAEADKVTLLRLRAELSTGPDEIDRAVADLEIAYGIDARATGKELALALDRRRATEAGAGDRALTLRLVEVLLAAGDDERARAVLGEWISRSPDDTVVLRRAAEIEGSSGRWDSAVQLCERLIELERGPARVEAALLLSGACAQAGYPLDARPLLETVWNDDPSDPRLREHLRRIYEEVKAHRELAGLFLAEANTATDPAERFAALRRAGQLFLEPDGDANAAVAPLETARELRPKDAEVTLLLTDAYIKSSRLQEAANFLDGAIAAQKGRRSREVSMMQHRMAHIARAVGDRSNELAWLNAAFESDAQNGEAASHLSEVATEFGQLDVAVKALKAITLMKSPKPLSRAQAYYRQALIAQHQGDVRKAAMLAKKAHQEDPSLEEASALIAQLGG